MKKIKYLLYGILLLVFTGFFIPKNDNIYFSPIDLEVDIAANQLFVAGKTANEVRSYKLSDFDSFSSITTELPPKAVKIAGENLLVACSYSHGELLILNKSTLQLESKIEVGHGACDVEVSNDLSKAYVANQYSNDISIVNLHEKQDVSRIPVLRQPKQITISKDGHYLFVANFLPASRSDIDTVASEITIIDLQTEQILKHIPLANGSNALRGMCSTTDGKYVLVTHNLGRFTVPTTQLEQGWMNTSALSIINAFSLELVATVILDESGHGAAGSWGVDCNQDYIFVAHSGTHDFSRIDYPAMIQKLENHPDKKILAYDLTFLTGIRERIDAGGNGPRALKSNQDQLYIGNYFSDDITIVNFGEASNGRLVHHKLNQKTQMDEIRLGEMYFHDATYCFQSWQSCTGCHPDDARMDGLNWDLLNDGMGNPKNCKSLLLSHETSPSMITGIRPSAEIAVRAGFEYIQFMKIDEEVSTAVDTYLKSLVAIPSPNLENGSLNATAKAGKIIFEKQGCNVCHPEPYFTDQIKYTMGTPGEYDHQNTWDTPTLVEVWRSGPYLHDGRCATLNEVFTKEKHGIQDELSEADIEKLVEYVLSL